MQPMEPKVVREHSSRYGYTVTLVNNVPVFFIKDAERADNDK
jgi:hypothetical protein